MNTNSSLTKAGQEAQYAVNTDTSEIGQESTGAVNQPVSRAVQQAARQFFNAIPRKTFLSACSLIAQNYLPQPAFITLLRETLPVWHNPIALLEKAKTVDHLANCHAGLVRTFGVNQHSKADLFGADQIDENSVPTHLIKNLLRILLANQNPPAAIAEQQLRRIAAFANYVAEFTESYPDSQQFIERLTRDDALAFLNCLSGHHSIRPFEKSTMQIQRKLALHFVDQDRNNIALLPHHLSHDRYFIEQAILIHPGRTLAFASEKLRMDPDIRKLVAYRQGDNTLDNPVAPDDIDNPLMVIAAACNDESELHYMGEELRNNRDFILAAVAHEPFVLSLVDLNLRDDPEFMLNAVSRHGWALEYANDNVGNRPEIVMTAVKKNGLALQFANEYFTNNHDIVFAAVNQDGGALRFASNELKDDKQIVLAAVKENPLALAYASDRLKNDFQTVHTAVRQDGSALRFASFRLIDNFGIVNTAINNDPLALNYASYRIKNNYEMVLNAVSKNGLALQYATPRLRQNQQLFRIASMNTPR